MVAQEQELKKQERKFITVQENHLPKKVLVEQELEWPRAQYGEEEAAHFQIGPMRILRKN